MATKKRKRPEDHWTMDALETHTREMLHTAVYTALNCNGIAVVDEECKRKTIKYIFSDFCSGAPGPAERHYVGSRYFHRYDCGVGIYKYTSACAINLASVIRRYFKDNPGIEHAVHQLKVCGTIDRANKMVYQCLEFHVEAKDKTK